MDDLSLRLARLEAEHAALRAAHRRLRAAALAGGLLVAGVAFAGFAAKPAPVDLVEAKRLTIVADDGKTLLSLGRDEDGGLLELFDANGQKTVALTTDSDGGMINVHSAGGPGVASMFVDADGGNLTLADQSSKPMMVLTTDADGGLAVVHAKKSGEPRLSYGIDEEGAGFLVTQNADGEPSGSVPGGEAAEIMASAPAKSAAAARKLR